MSKILDKKLLIAGPCAVESYEQTMKTAEFVKKLGLKFFRAGAFKPRTSPESFQGKGKEALDILRDVKKSTGLLVVTELMDTKDMDRVYDVADIIQIGSRNMHNYSLLKEVGKNKKPVILKRGMSATIKEWIHASEYIKKEGNKDIIMCERGIRTFENYTRNTLDLSSVPIIKKETNLKVIVDPSHGTGMSELIKPMSLGALAVGADGLMIEIHPEPEKALSDGEQSLNFTEFEKLLTTLKSTNINQY